MLYPREFGPQGRAAVSAFAEPSACAVRRRQSIAHIDQLIHHAEIITIEGDSYRGRAAEQTRRALSL